MSEDKLDEDLYDDYLQEQKNLDEESIEQGLPTSDDQVDEEDLNYLQEEENLDFQINVSDEIGFDSVEFFNISEIESFKLNLNERNKAFTNFVNPDHWDELSQIYQLLYKLVIENSDTSMLDEGKLFDKERRNSDRVKELITRRWGDKIIKGEEWFDGLYHYRIDKQFLIDHDFNFKNSHPLYGIRFFARRNAEDRKLIIILLDPYHMVHNSQIRIKDFNVHCLDHKEVFNEILNDNKK